MCAIMTLIFIAAIAAAIIYMNQRTDCDLYFYYLEGMDGCAQDECSTLQILLPSGRCEQCPKGEHAAPQGHAEEGKVCLRQECTEFEYQDPNGRCSSEYCSKLEYLAKGGRCKKCPHYHIQDLTDMTKCIKADCYFKS